MTSDTETSLTAAVSAQFAKTPDPRLRELLLSLTSHLHAFARETALTFDEWHQGIEFLTRTGHMCKDGRQEFILLSDVLGLSMLVDAIGHRTQDSATESTVLGPFFVDDAPTRPNGADIGAGLAGDLLLVTAVVAGADRQPLADADVVVWQCDEDGFYDIQYAARDGYFLRGRFRTDAQGQIQFWSIVPPAYPIPDDGPVGDLLKASDRHPWRPAHVHFHIAAAGHRTLVTHLFLAGGNYLDSDVVFGVKPSLVVDLATHDPGTAPDGRHCPVGWKTLDRHFQLAAL